MCSKHWAFSSPKTRNGTFLGPFFGWNAPLGGGIEISTQEPDFDPIFCFATHFRVTKTSKCQCTKKHLKMLFETPCFKNLLLTKGNVHIAKMIVFSKFRFPSFLHCVFYHLRHGRQKKKMSRGARFQGFWDFLAHFEVEGGRNFSCRDV